MSSPAFMIDPTTLQIINPPVVAAPPQIAVPIANGVIQTVQPALQVAPAAIQQIATPVVQTAQTALNTAQAFAQPAATTVTVPTGAQTTINVPAAPGQTTTTIEEIEIGGFKMHPCVLSSLVILFVMVTITFILTILQITGNI